jgi:hypothetical protein
MTISDAPICGIITDNSRGVIYNPNIFILQAIGLVMFFMSMFKSFFPSKFKFKMTLYYKIGLFLSDV